MIVSTHQVGYFPWLGLFDKIAKSDVFIILDDVQYAKRDFQNRTLVKATNGNSTWLTVPVLAKGHQSQNLKIKDIQIDQTQKFQKKHYNNLLFNYKKAKYWKDHEPFLKEMFFQTEWRDLLSLNIHTLNYLLKELDINVKLMYSSQMNVSGAKSDLMLSICKEIGAKTYLSGTGAKDYMDDNLFLNEGIEVVYQEFNHPSYEQLHGEFIDGMGAIDLILNCGDESKHIFNDNLKKEL